MPTIAVILPDDSHGAKRSIQYGQQLAEAFDGNLTIIPVYDEQKHTGVIQRKAMAGSEVTKLEDVRETLSDSTLEIVEPILVETDSWSVDVFIGNLPSGLVEKLETEGVDHLVVPAERTSPTGKMIFGDLAQSLVLNTSIPTTVLTEK